MPLIPFPDVPNVPGVPAIFRDMSIPSISQLARYGLGALTEQMFDPPRWGVFGNDGREVLIFETFLGINFKNSGKISSYPMERNSFSSFNKVSAPFDVTVQLAQSADQATRADMLSALERIVRDTELYSVITPDITYPSVNLVEYSYEREPKNGPNYLAVKLMLTEVRETAVPTFSATKEPSGTAKKSNGQVQASSTAGDSGRGQRRAGTRGAVQ